MTNKGKLNAALYARVSTQRQVLEGFSLEAQKENLANFAVSQGWNVYDYYADEGISGKNIKDRPEVKRLINDIKSQNIDVVVLYKFDRLTRDSRDTEDFIELIQNYDIIVYAISGGIVDVSSPSGRFNTRILGAAAQFERETLIDRVVDGLIKKVKNGYSLCSGIVSYGYNRPKHQEIQTINEEEAQVVRRIFKLYIDGKSFTEICNILNSENIRPKNYGLVRKLPNKNEYHIIKSIWQPKTIRQILNNVNYIGKVRYGVNREQVTITEANDYKNRQKGFITDGLHQPIIDLPTWEKAQERLKKINSHHRTNHPKEDAYYCGFLICGSCGHRLTSQRTCRHKKDGSIITYLSYRCVNREKGLCPATSSSHQKVEKAFIKYLSNIANLEDIEKYQPVTNSDNNLKENINNIQKRLLQKNNKLKEIMKLFMENQLTINEYHIMREQITKDCHKLKKELEYLKSQDQLPKENINYNIIPKQIKDHWINLTNKEKLSFLTQFIKKIIIITKSNNNSRSTPIIQKIEFYKE